MELVKTTHFLEWREIRKLYKNAFPRYERKPIWLIRRAYKKGSADVWVICQRGEFSGFAITMNTDDLVLLDYFAISEEKRCKGLGAEALKSLYNIYSGKRFFLEIESVYVHSENISERKRRKRFYLANGMSEIGVMARVFGTEMELLGHNCKLTFDEYCSVYLKNYGKWAAKNIVESKKILVDNDKRKYALPEKECL